MVHRGLHRALELIIRPTSASTSSFSTTKVTSFESSSSGKGRTWRASHLDLDSCVDRRLTSFETVAGDSKLWRAAR